MLTAAAPSSWCCLGTMSSWCDRGPELSSWLQRSESISPSVSFPIAAATTIVELLPAATQSV